MALKGKKSTKDKTKLHVLLNFVLDAIRPFNK
jgi:hypothetical protein